LAAKTATNDASELAINDDSIFNNTESIDYSDHDSIEPNDTQQPSKEKVSVLDKCVSACLLTIYSLQGLNKKDQLEMYKESQRLIRRKL
jgi:hypothetical protein